MTNQIEGHELEKVSAELQTSFFNNKDQFEHVQRVAKMFSQSDLVPKVYKEKIGNCVIALEMANRMGASPLLVMQNLNIILGTPAWSSKFLIATLNASGKFSPLRYEQDEKNGGRCRAWALDKINNEKCYGAWVTMDMAKEEQWLSKSGSKWKTMPELMLRYRAASFFTNQFAPEISMGLATVEEVYDIPFQEVRNPVNIDKQSERIELMINDCKTLEDLETLGGSVDMNPAQIDLFNAKKDEILMEIYEAKLKAENESN